MIRWLRVVLPRPGMILIAFLVYALFEGCILVLEWGFRQPVAMAVRPGVMIFYGTCLAYGWSRAQAFHPALNKPYAQWLETTPWTSRMPLPLGPVHLVSQDLLLVGLMVCLGFFQAGLDPLMLVPTFLGAYLVPLGFSLALTRRPSYVYGVAFGLGLVVRLTPYPLLCIAAAAAVYLIGYVGLRRSLANFPWNTQRLDDVRRQFANQSPENPANTDAWFGWPFDRLRPKWPESVDLSSRDAVLMSLLFGWWLYAVAALIDPVNRLNLLYPVPGLVIWLLIAARLCLYCVGYLPPISLWGRLLTLRWIIPGYDKVFLAPMGTFLVSGLIIYLSDRQGMDPLIYMPCAFAMAMLVALAGGPTLKSWRLTGNHRIVPALLSAANKGQFVKVGG